MSPWQNFIKGFIKENPVFVLVLGTCPTLAVTTSVANAIGMGLSTTFVLVTSNIAIAALKDFIPDKVRIPCFIVVIASFVTIVDLVMAGFFQVIHSQLGIFIPLIVVNCIVLGRAEAYAAKNSLLPSAIDGLSMGLGFTFALLILSTVREALGEGSFLGHKFIHSDGILFFILAPGAFIVFGYVIAIINRLNRCKK
ncbi:MAG: electron transport complex subunit E [Candidatus Omnitrophota bacterium]|jgi:electron transport complex protein RnfE